MLGEHLAAHQTVVAGAEDHGDAVCGHARRLPVGDPGYLPFVATNERLMPVPPEAVWKTLTSAADYADWVFGSKEIRAADHDWPAPGSRFHHTVGVGPLTLKDHTEALESRSPELLRMRVRVRPFGTATVTLELLRSGSGTLVRMTEHPAGIARILAMNPLFELLTKARNAKSLERLQELAQRGNA